jgi:hypothetical protein
MMKRLGIYRTRPQEYANAFGEGVEREPLFKRDADDGLSGSNDALGMAV